MVNAGERLTLSLTATNRSKSKSSKLRLRVLMSDDRRESKDDVPLGKVKIPALLPRKSKTAALHAKVLEKTEPAVYSVLICGSKCRPMKGPIGVGPPTQRVDVSPGLDSASAASAAIDGEGGRVDALATDGTTYSLIVPAGALASPTQITMTPLASLVGSPLGAGLVGGVQLEPDGLELAKTATLVIQGDRIAPGPGQTGFAYHANGQDFHLEPLYRQAPPGSPTTTRARQSLSPSRISPARESSLRSTSTRCATFATAPWRRATASRNAPRKQFRRRAMAALRLTPSSSGCSATT